MHYPMIYVVFVPIETAELSYNRVVAEIDYKIDGNYARAADKLKTGIGSNPNHLFKSVKEKMDSLFRRQSTNI